MARSTPQASNKSRRPEPDAHMSPASWLTMPHQVDRQIAAWQAQESLASYLAVEHRLQYTGEAVYALTVTDFSLPREEKKAIWMCVPHAHEPAGTAAIMNVLQQLLTGWDLEGQPCSYDRQHILKHIHLTCNPDANPGGRCWAPVLWWDGQRYTNDEFWQWMRGVDPLTEGMWQRVARWSLRDQSPLRRGIVYEQINQHEFVEPNRDPESSLMRLYRDLDARVRFDVFLDLHQTEFVQSDRNCMLLLPLAFPTLTDELQKRIITWGRDIIEHWHALRTMARPVAAPREFPYSDDEQTVAWFRATWDEIDQRIPRLTVEVQNNSPHTPPGHQRALMESAIWRTLSHHVES